MPLSEVFKFLNSLCSTCWYSLSSSSFVLASSEWRQKGFVTVLHRCVLFAEFHSNGFIFSIVAGWDSIVGCYHRCKEDSRFMRGKLLWKERKCWMNSKTVLMFLKDEKDVFIFIMFVIEAITFWRKHLFDSIFIMFIHSFLSGFYR